MPEPTAMRMAYADPPYPGESARHYRNHPDYAGEADHVELIARLVLEYPDGWALSTKSSALRVLLPLCPPKARVMAWTKPFCAFKKGVNPAYAWEPVIVFGGRRRGPDEHYRRDYIAAKPPAFAGVSTGVHGTKPREFCYWLFDILGLRAGDDLHDLFPGSGAVGQAWRGWCGLPPEEQYEQCALAMPGWDLAALRARI